MTRVALVSNLEGRLVPVGAILVIVVQGSSAPHLLERSQRAYRGALVEQVCRQLLTNRTMAENMTV